LFDFAAYNFQEKKKNKKNENNRAIAHTHTHTQIDNKKKKRNVFNGMIIEIIKEREREKRK